MFSEFDEIASNIPWYMQSSHKTESEASESLPSTPSKEQSLCLENARMLAERSRSRSRPRIKREERHGQMLVRVKSPKIKFERDLMKLENSVESEVESMDALGVGCEARVRCQEREEG